MNSFDPTVCFDAWQHIAPLNRKVLAFDCEEMGWWTANYVPDDENPEYQPRAWHFAGLDFYQPFVTHWMFLPPAPERSNSERLLG